MNVAIVGSRGINVPHAAAIVEELLGALENPKVLVRWPRSEKPQAFERAVDEIATRLGLECIHSYPDRRGGREGTYVRDAHLATTADIVFAFFTRERLMEGGTGHVVEKAWDKETPVYAYEISDEGLQWVGSVE